jgi:hypothetical protein
LILSLPDAAERRSAFIAAGCSSFIRTARAQIDIAVKKGPLNAIALLKRRG